MDGWTVRPVKKDELGLSDHKIGDVMYEVKFERIDPVSMEEVLKHPTAFELDDYTEYKRLRRIHCEGPRKLTAAKQDVHSVAKAAPPIPPMIAPTSQLRALSQVLALPGRSRSPTSKQLIKKLPGSPEKPQSPSNKSLAVPDVDSYFTLHKNTFVVPIPTVLRTGTVVHNPQSDSSKSEKSLVSHVSSARTHRSNLDEIREVAPWIDLDLGLTAASPMTALGLPCRSIANDSIRAPSRAASGLTPPNTSKNPSPKGEADETPRLERISTLEKRSSPGSNSQQGRMRQKSQSA